MIVVLLNDMNPKIHVIPSNGIKITVVRNDIIEQKQIFSFLLTP